MRVVVEVTADDLTDSIDYDQESAFAFITKLDSDLADYEFTERLAKYFIQTLIIECEHGAEPFDIMELMPKQ